MKFGCAICIFLNSENRICRSTDISKCFRGSLQLRDNESRLYACVVDMNVEYGETIKEYISECSGNLAVYENDFWRRLILTFMLYHGPRYKRKYKDNLQGFFFFFFCFFF